jgi:polyribonucleotide nucleotidyltransferase
MAAGVPIKRAVAGIAMGLLADLNDPTKYKVITDIQGIEDHSGDMDFKVAGTTQGITAIQLDIKSGGITMDVIREALDGALKARLKILEVMGQAIAAPRADMSPYAPRIETMQIDPEMIRVLIGPGGKTINQIIDETGVGIDVEKDGTVFITSANAEGLAKAKQWVEQLTKEVKVGEDYEGTITQIIKGRMNGDEIGAIVEFLPGKDGMVHISEIANYRIAKVSDVWKIGDRVKVRVKDVDREAGKISLSHRPFSEDITAPEAPAPHHGDGGRGGFDRPRGGYDRGPRHHGGDRHERPPMRPDQPTQPFQPLDRMTPEPRQDLDV